MVQTFLDPIPLHSMSVAACVSKPTGINSSSYLSMKMIDSPDL